MGSLRGGDGDGRPPPDNGGLPDLPPEWGTVVVPDDLAELDREADRCCAASAAAAIAGDPLASPARPRAPIRTTPTTPPVGIPLLIMSIAIIAALTSLFAITLTTPTRPTDRRRNAAAADADGRRRR